MKKKIKYEYDAEYKVISKALIVGEKVEEVWNYQYDENGRLSQRSFSRYGVVAFQAAYSYNEQGLVQERKYYEETAGSLQLEEIYNFEYNAAEEPIKVIIQERREGQEEAYPVTVISEKSIETNQLAGDRVEQVITTKRLDLEGGGSESSKMVKVFDSHEQLRESSHYAANGDLTSHNSYDYRYDEKGNWILLEEYNSDKKMKVTKREIVY